MIARLRERPGKTLPVVLFAAAAALIWWLGLLALGVVEILFNSDPDQGISEAADEASWWIALAGLVVVPVATFAWSKAIHAGVWSVAAGALMSFVVYLLLVVPIYMLWVVLYDAITGDEWVY